MAFVTVMAVLIAVVLPYMTVFAAPASGALTGVDGRILTTEQTGDSSDWVEIARYNGSSLIVRANYIKLSGYRNYDPDWQYTSFGTDMKYQNSFVRNKINHWFSGVPDYANWEDVLPPGARLREYTLQHNALSKLGTCNTITAMTDGLSEPTKYKVGIGNDIAFALSYSESANYLSSIHFQRNNNLADQPSNAIAIANVQKVNIPGAYVSGMWLRSPGDCANTVGALDNEGFGRFRVFQFYITSSASQKGYIYPALWVDSAIFGPSGYTVTYDPNGGTGDVVTRQAAANSNYVIEDQGYTNAGFAFAGWNTERNGTGAAYQNNDTIFMSGDINLYAQWTKLSSIVYHSNLFGSDEVYVDYGDNGIFTIKSGDGMFDYNPYVVFFYYWNTEPDYTGIDFYQGTVLGSFSGTLHLYGRWLIET